MMTLSVIVPTLNEEKDLSRCLESLNYLDATVIVVDSGSQDKTVEIAKKAGAKVVEHPFESYSAQRNYADNLVNEGWILSIEADVTVPPELALEISKAIQSDKFTAYKIERINNIWGKNIMHSDWGPKDDCHIWLYKKGSGEWKSQVHEEYFTDGKTGKLNNRLYHHNYDSISEFLDKENRYSELAVKQHTQFPWFWPIRDFIKRYFWKQGFLDGYHGLFLSYLQSIYFITLSVKNWEFLHKRVDD